MIDYYLINHILIQVSLVVLSAACIYACVKINKIEKRQEKWEDAVTSIGDFLLKKERIVELPVKPNTKFRTEEQKKKQSEKMKQVWAQRKAKKKKSPPPKS